MEYTLEVPKASADLTGNKLGRKLYDEQIRPRLSENTTIRVYIPKQINDVGVSFVQGIYAYLSEQYGKDKALQMMILESDNPRTQERINRVIEVYGV